MRNWVALAMAVGIASGVHPSAADEDAAGRAFAALRSGKLDEKQADAQVRALADAMDRAKLTQTATVALSTLASQQDAAGAAAARELQRRARAGGLALALAVRLPIQGLDPAAAVRIARAHLDQALVLAPPPEGSAFAPMETADGPALLPAAAGAPLRTASPEEAAQPIVSAVQRLANAELERARQIAAQVPAGDAAEGEAHEVSALAALASGDTAAAEQELAAVVRIVPKGDAAIERHENAMLQLARLAYARGDDARAQALYARVSRGAPQWLDALFESSWSHFRRGEDEKALGNLLTLHAPFFQGRYFPESHVLEALLLYENCRYAEARRALQEFQGRYRPVHDSLARALQSMPTAQTVADALTSGPQTLLASVPELARPELRRLLATPEMDVSVRQIVAIASELDSMDQRGIDFRSSTLALVVVPHVREARIDLLQRTAERARTALAMERSELRELLGQALRLDFEIAGREKELAAAPRQSIPVASRRPRTQVDDDEELWPFQGEYWRDELGSYRFQLSDRCAHQPKAPPPQEAGLPARAPAAAASAESAAPAP